MANIYGLTNTVFPDDIQTFKTWEDLAPTDALYYLQYINALANSQTAQAKLALQNIENHQNKLPTAIDFNTICDTLIACEKLYSEGGAGEAVTEFLNQFSYKGVWLPEITYTKFNMVNYVIDGVPWLFLCVKSSSRGETPTPSSTTTWVRISIANPANVNSTWKGIYASANQYVAGDVVSYNNTWYLAITDNPSSPPSSDWASIVDFDMYNPVVSATSPQIPSTLWFQII